jgi:hypothetical protein
VWGYQRGCGAIREGVELHIREGVELSERDVELTISDAKVSERVKQLLCDKCGNKRKICRWL